MTVEKPRIAIVAAMYNKEIIEPMISTAQRDLISSRATLVELVKVPGCYELPVIVNELLVRPEVDAVIVLGYIEKGETLHGEVMGHVVHHAMVRLELEHGKAIGLGIIGPGATEEQARARIIGSAEAATKAALQNSKTLSELRKSQK